MEKAEQFKQCLMATCPELLNFDTAVLLGGWIADCRQPIVKDNYALAEITKKTMDVVRTFRNKTPDPFWFDRSRYVLAFNSRSKRASFHRMDAYLKNIATIQLRNAAARVARNESMWSIFISKTAISTGECELLNTTGSSVDYTADIFDLMFSVTDSDNPAPDDFDVRLILSWVDQKNTGLHLFKAGGEIISSNYRSNKRKDNHDALLYERLQQHERELADRMLAHPNYQGNRTDAAVDLALAGHDSNLVLLMENPMMALYLACAGRNQYAAAVSSLFKRALDVRQEITYPVEQDFILDPAAVNRETAAMKARGGVFVYCCNGRLCNTEYGGIIESIVIPPELKPLMLEHTGLGEYDVYPDAESLMGDRRNRESSAFED